MPALKPQLPYDPQKGLAFSEGAAFAAKIQAGTETYAAVGKRASITMD